MSELEQLRKFKERADIEIAELRDEVLGLVDKADDLQQDLLDIENDTSRTWIEVSSLPDEMKKDFIIENWEKITLENLEAIV
jgi:hypothetical protein